MKFEDIKKDTPCLVIAYKVENGKPSFGWTPMPGLPLPHIIGYIGRVQVAIANGVSGLVPCEGHECTNNTFVIAWDAQAQSFDWWRNKMIPVDALLGQLEAIKLQLLSGTVMQRATSQSRQLLGPDGRPFKM